MLLRRYDADWMALMGTSYGMRDVYIYGRSGGERLDRTASIKYILVRY